MCSRLVWVCEALSQGMAEAEVKDRKEWLLPAVMVSHTTQLVCKRVEDPAPSERNRCLSLGTTRSFWNGG